MLLIAAYHFSAQSRKERRALAALLLRWAGAPQPIELRLRRYESTIWIRPFDAGDVQSFVEVFVRRVYPVPGGGLVVDAGANVGCFSVFAMEEGAARHLVAVEPDPRNIPLLRRNLAPYGDRVTIVEAALWSSEGRGCLRLNRQSNLSHLTETAWVEPGLLRTASVRTVTPESREMPHPEHIDYLKLDVEGAEAAILDLYVQRLKRGARLVAELHGGEVIDRFGPRLSDKWTVLEDGPPDCVVVDWTV